MQAEIKTFLEEITKNVEKSGYACRAFTDRCMWLQENYEVMLATDDYFSVRNNRKILFPNLISDQSEIKTETMHFFDANLKSWHCFQNFGILRTEYLFHH